jgi:hypothetical protein
VTVARRAPECPVCGHALAVTFLLESLAALALAEPLSEQAAKRRAELWADVGALLAADPDASANAVSAALAWRRQDVLMAVRVLRDRRRPVPEPRNHTEERSRRLEH